MKLFIQNHKKILYLLPIIICILICGVFLTACGKSETPENEEELGENYPIYETLDLSFMKSLTANIDDATAIGIRPMSVNDAKVEEIDESKPEEIFRYYLVKYTDIFDTNTPEFDESGLTKVSFTLTRETTEEIYDENGNLIELNQTITQDELSAQINKYYVYGNFTLIQFIPEIANSGYVQFYNESNVLETMYIDVRPAELEFDENGIALYDKVNYYTDELHQSFIINNETGYIYLIENFCIDEIKNNLILSDNKIYDIKITANDELQFISVVQNESLEVIDYWKDVYGNIFVRNNYLDELDAENNVMFFTASRKYLLSKENITIHLEGNYDYISPTEFTLICKVSENFKDEIILQNEKFTINYDNLKGAISNINIRGVYDGYLYTDTQGGNTFSRTNIETLTIETKAFPFTNMSMIDYNTVLIFTNLSGTSKLYYAKVWGENAYTWDDNIGFTEENLNILLDDCKYASDDYWSILQKDYTKLKFLKATPSQTIYYQVVLDEENVPVVVDIDKYIAPEKEIITLQPINRNTQ